MEVCLTFDIGDVGDVVVAVEVDVEVSAGTTSLTAIETGGGFVFEYMFESFFVT